MFGEFIAVGPEGIGFNHIRPGLDIGAVDGGNLLRMCQVEGIKTCTNFGAVLVQERSHGAIAQQRLGLADAVEEGCESHSDD